MQNSPRSRLVNTSINIAGVEIARSLLVPARAVCRVLMPPGRSAHGRFHGQQPAGNQYSVTFVHKRQLPLRPDMLDDVRRPKLRACAVFNGPGELLQVVHYVCARQNVDPPKSFGAFAAASDIELDSVSRFTHNILLLSGHGRRRRRHWPRSCPSAGNDMCCSRRPL